MSNKIDNKSIKIGILSIVATIVIGVISVLISLHRPQPNLEYTIISSTDLFNSSEPSPYIKVFLGDSIDVQEKHYNITTYSIKVENKGNKAIVYGDYNPGFFGVKIHNGILLDKPTLLSTSSEYIDKLFTLDTILDSSMVEIQKITLDEDDYYILKIVVLHKNDSVIYFEPEGKIAGQKKIELVEQQEKTPTFWLSAFAGNWKIQIVRIIVYLIIAIIIISIIIMVVSKVEDKISSRKIDKEIKNKEIEKNNREEKIKALQSIDENVKIEYINNGWEPHLQKLSIIIQGDENSASLNLKKDCCNLINDSSSLDYISSHNKYYSSNFIDKEIIIDEKNEIVEWLYLIKNKFISITDKMEVKFDYNIKTSVNALYSFLMNNRTF